MGYEPGRQPAEEPEYDPESLAHAGAPGGDLIGRTLAGRYRFDALVGEGSFAQIYRVTDLNRRVPLAAKVLRRDIAHERAFLERFRREAAVLARLQHPHIVRYYDIVEADDVVFILTDYIAGETLQTVLFRRAAPLSPLETLEYLQPLAAALHFAHSEGVIHRDLKPANILIDPHGQLYVTDFGIARIISEASTLTVDTTLGTPHYMSPEQILAGEVTAAADIYALGVLLYQMLTGRLPFTGDSPAAQGSSTAVRIVYEHLHVPPAPPRAVNPSISPEIERVILRCLEKDPAQRFPSVSAVYTALSEAIGTPSLGLDRAAALRAEAQRDEAEDLPGAAEWPAPDREAEAEPVPEWTPKPKRKAKPQPVPARGEKEREKEEKEHEKERDSKEKEEEKGTEKSDEKSEFWGEIAPSDRLSQFTLGGIVLWAGIVFLLNNVGAGGGLFGNVWAWVLGGAGALLVAEVAARLTVPEFRTRPGARLTLGLVLLMLGAGMGFGVSTSFWPLLLIAIGASLLINRLFG